MEQTVRFRWLRHAAVGMFVVLVGAFAGAQETPPAITTPAAGPSAVANPALSDPMTQALEPVREAIGQHDYPGARMALEKARRIDPNHPNIALYESLIKRRQTMGETLESESPIRTPRPGVTPMPVAETTPTPAPVSATPAAGAVDSDSTVAPQSTSADGILGKAKDLLKNDLVRYGLFGAVGLIILGFLFKLLKKRRDRPEEEIPASTGALTMGGMDDHLAADDESFNSAAGGGLSSSAAAGDFSPNTIPDYNATPSAPSTGSALGGLAAAGGMADFSMPGFEGEEEEEPVPPKPAPKAKPSAPAEQDTSVNIFNEGESSPAAPSPSPQGKPQETSPKEPVEPKEPSDAFNAPDISFDTMEKPTMSEQPTLQTLNEPKPFDDEETVILNPDAAPGPSAPQSDATPSSPASTSLNTPGTVDLEDIFGSQPLPGQTEPVEPASAAPTSLTPSEPTGEDLNAQTLSTFVSTPGAGNPEESIEIPPTKNLRPKPAENSETQSISFEELFGSPEESSAETPSATAEPVAEQPKPAEPATELSIEDALSATLGDMEAQSPAAEPAGAETESSNQAPESLDERTERMFSDQMTKARQAVEDKNWRQAVHVLSIASALHPENDEAKQMLKDARAEKRKAEESV